ncbi:MAG: DegV family protein [Oscillospiraceae bacterium]|nr:DegV family protein [Oscillospiraceae bacterium]
MAKIKVTCDSTCDLTKEIYDKLNVSVMPLGVYLGEELKRDGVTATALEIFDYVSKTGVLPKTSACSIGEYADFFKQFTDEGCEVIHINIGSDLSASHQNARLAAEELEGVYVIDSKNLSSGSGHLVIEACEMAQNGMEACDIAAKLNEMVPKLDVSFVVQTLDYLYKGGRCSGVAALGANLLKLRPCIDVKDGKLGVGKKYRGNITKTLRDYITDRLSGRDDLDLKRIFITHSHAPAEVVAELKELIAELAPFEEIIETVAGCTITSHCGPDCLGILFFTK